MTSCTSTRVRTLMGRYWRAYKATRPQSESRAAGTVSSWRSDPTPHWACLALLSNIEVTQPGHRLPPPSVFDTAGDRAVQQLAPSSHSKNRSRVSVLVVGFCCMEFLLLSMSSLPGSLDFLSHPKDLHEWLIGCTKLAQGVVVSVGECCVPD